MEQVNGLTSKNKIMKYFDELKRAMEQLRKMK